MPARRHRTEHQENRTDAQQNGAQYAPSDHPDPPKCLHRSSQTDLARAKRHGHRYARMRGLNEVQQQCLLAATAQNIKKIALMLSRMGPNTPLQTILTLLNAYIDQVRRYEEIDQTDLFLR